MRRPDVLAAAGLLVPPGVVIGLHIYIGSFNRMLGDDYCTTYMAQRLGLLRSIWYWYINWHGRFAANIADWLISLFGSEGYPVHTLVFLATWVMFAFLAVKKALDFRGYALNKIVAALLLAVLLIFTTLSLTPDIIESLFWWGGVRSYLSPLILTGLYFAFYFHLLSAPRSRVQITIGSLLSFGLGFLMGGFSETFTPVLVFLFAVLLGGTWLVSTWSRRVDAIPLLSAGFLGALLSLLVMVLAPGNAIRRAFFPAPPDVFTILRISFASYFTFLYNSLGSAYSLTALLGSILGSVWLGMNLHRNSEVKVLPGQWIAIILFVGFLLAFACFPTAVYATSEPPPERTMLAPAFILVVCFLVGSFGLGQWLASHTGQRLSSSNVLLMIAGVFLFFSSWNGFQRLYSMRDEHLLFAQRWDQVDAQIRAAKNSGLQEIHIPSMTNWADAEYPTDNPKYWPNVCYSKFYDINVVAPPLQPE